MSKFRPTIETLYDWNAAIQDCGCCEMPEFDAPLGYYRTRSKGVTVFPWVALASTWDASTWSPDGTCAEKRGSYTGLRIERTRVISGVTYESWSEESHTRNADGSYSTVNTNGGDAVANAVVLDGSYDTYSRSGYTFTATKSDRTIKYIFTGVLTEAAAYQEAIDGVITAIETQSFGSISTSDMCSLAQFNFSNTFWANLRIAAFNGRVGLSECNDAFSFPDGDPITIADQIQGIQITNFNGRQVEYKFQIPSDFEGTYCKVTYDIARFTSGWIDGNLATPQPVIVSTDVTHTWTGPVTDAASRLFPATWQVLDPPVTEDLGWLAIVNFRWEYYRSPWGPSVETCGRQVEP